ncbi:MAG: SDR family oxidoreductase [Aeropyrum sp.]|nr:SDR family oxidoreductase [Aeropyrum sp.]MCE4616085.1 SDR family oxidoreductase [Aeropyrum sp.]
MGKVFALVTGGSRGIGRAVALRFAREGYGVIVTYRNRGDLAGEVVRKAKSIGAPIAEAIQMDVSSVESVRSARERVEELVDYLNVLVNNAGVLHVGGIEETTPEDWNRVINVNLTGPFIVTKEFLPLLYRAEWASIVNLASIAGQTGNVVASAAYSASKAGVIGLTKRLAVELAERGIRVNAVAPSFVETDMVKDFIDTQEKRRRVEELHPLRTIVKPEDVAEAVLFLADPRRSRAVTGHVLQVNAGRLT